jgi:hypothetical protein
MLKSRLRARNLAQESNYAIRQSRACRHKHLSEALELTDDDSVLQITWDDGHVSRHRWTCCAPHARARTVRATRPNKAEPDAGTVPWHQVIGYGGSGRYAITLFQRWPRDGNLYFEDAVRDSKLCLSNLRFADPA